MTEPGSDELAKPKCLDVVSWRLPTYEELRAFMDSVYLKQRDAEGLRNPSVLAVRHHLSPVDVYCYLKGRFGEPNGFQNFLRKDHSDNLIHWDFTLRAGDEDICIFGMTREIHFVMSAKLTDENWRDLILAIKADYKRVATEKSAVLKSLEQWVIFPNRFSEIAAVCANLHANIIRNIDGFHSWKHTSSAKEQYSVLKRLFNRAARLHRSCLELSLLTPVLAEAFVNMLILILCKPEIRRNKRHFESFIRSQIDTKLFDLAHKCRGFVRPISEHEETFKNFKKVMDKRNHRIHGNCDPEQEQIELVYFDGKRPLFKAPGDRFGKFLDSMERQYEPDVVIRDYENTHAFLNDLINHLEPGLTREIWFILEDHYPGYDIGRKKVGHLFPGNLVHSAVEGIKYDDELKVWD
jgi:hypothetical protein